MEVGAIICALALLFPVISLTDDLHPETAVVDSASGKRHCLVVAQDAHNHQTTRSPSAHSAMARLQNPLAPMDFISEGIDFAFRLQTSVFLASPPIGRSPPSLQVEIN